MATTSPVRTSSTTPAEAFGLELLARGDELVAQRVLDAQVDRKRDRLLLPVGGEAGAVQVREPARVEPLFDAGDRPGCRH